MHPLLVSTSPTKASGLVKTSLLSFALCVFAFLAAACSSDPSVDEEWASGEAVSQALVVTATYPASGIAGCTGTKNCSAQSWGVDLNEGAGYLWNVDGGTGGNASLYIRVAVPSGQRSMGMWVNGTKIGVLTTTSTLSPRFGGAEHGPFAVSLTAGNNTVELRDSESTGELDVHQVRIVASGCATAADCSDGNACTNDVCTAGACSNPDSGLCECQTNADCNDGSSCTNDSCNGSNQCVHVDNGSCVSSVPSGTYVANTIAGCTFAKNCSTNGTTLVDLNGDTGYLWNVAGGSGGSANLFVKVAVPSGVRAMSLWVNGVQRGIVSASGASAPRPNGAEFGPFAVSFIAGNNTVELRDTQGTAEFDVYHVRVEGGAPSGCQSNGECSDGNSCTSDVCTAGTCSNPDNGTCSAIPTGTYAATSTAACTFAKDCSFNGTAIDLNANTGYSWSVPGGSGGSADLYFRVAVPSGDRAMSVWVNGNPAGLVVTASGASAPRPNGAELGPFPAAFTAGNNLVELRDTQGTTEFDVLHLRVAVGGTGPCTPSREICDGRDNDCDGKVDESYLCMAAATAPTIDQLINTCPSAAVLDAIDEDFDIRFQLRDEDGNGTLDDPAGNALVCTAAQGSRNLTRSKERMYQALIALRALVFNHSVVDPFPWTSEQNLYAWMRGAVDGILMDSSAGSSFCCTSLPEGQFLTIQNGPNRYFTVDTTWNYLSSLAQLLIHEARHGDAATPDGTLPHTCGGAQDNLIEDYNGYGVAYKFFTALAFHSNPCFLRPTTGGTFYQTVALNDAKVMFQPQTTSPRFCSQPSTPAELSNPIVGCAN